MEYHIHTDGGSRGNPGAAAVGFVIEGADIGKKEYGEVIGHTTNNVAEYSAVIHALNKLKQLAGTDKTKRAKVNISTDSELLVKQMTGKYKIKDPGMQKLFIELWNLQLDFGSVKWYHVPREQNKDADRMVNHALDKQADRLI